MSKEAEILKTGMSFHDTLLPKIKQIKAGHLRYVGLTKIDSQAF